MEYYAGILFLTTNRVGDFDEAFTSRIHISLYYPELNADKTVGVFKLNMDMIKERFARKGRKINIDEVGIGGFASTHFTAHAQARWKRPTDPKCLPDGAGASRIRGPGQKPRRHSEPRRGSQSASAALRSCARCLPRVHQVNGWPVRH